jgi:predicted nucleic acid-binding protein
VIVLDSSYALALVMPDESCPASMPHVLGERLLAPFIWPIELANAMRTAVQRSRLRDSEVTGLCADIDEFNVEVVAPWQQAALRYVEVARTHGLTPYDALYLDLALTRRCGLATRDQRLIDASRRVGVTIHD